MKNDGRFKPLTQSEFMERARTIHGDKYDYFKSIYINSKTKIIIKCQKHGDFYQQPRHHLFGKGCRDCARDNLRMPQSTFIDLATSKHNGFYLYHDVIYETARKKVRIICPKHGYFNQTPHEHLKGAGCAKCANELNRNSEHYVLSEFNRIHGDRYIYDKFKYKTGMTKSTITCKTHGDFEQYARYHIRGWGCPKCHNGSWTKNDFIEMCGKKTGQATLYLIKCTNDTELFYKVGITSNTTNERFNNKTLMPYQFSIIAEFTGDPSNVWINEKKINRVTAKLSYKPKIKFHGSSRECFSKLTPEVLDFFGVKNEVA